MTAPFIAYLQTTAGKRVLGRIDAPDIETAAALARARFDIGTGCLAVTRADVGAPTDEALTRRRMIFDPSYQRTAADARSLWHSIRTARHRATLGYINHLTERRLLTMRGGAR